MPSEMQERIARAIYEDRNGAGCVPWSRRDRAHKAPYLSDALAAMKATQSYADEARDEWGFEHGDFEDVLKAEIAAAEEARRDQD